MVGELDVAIAGQKATILFLNDHVLVRFADFRSALSIVNQPMPSLKLIGKLLSFSEIGLKAQVGKRRQIQLFPQPSLIVRWLSPALRDLVRAADD